MQAEMTEQTMPMSGSQVTPPPQRSSRLMLVLYTLLVGVFLAALAAYGYSQGWFKQAGNQASDVIAANFPSMAKNIGVEDSVSKARTAFAGGDIKSAIEGYRQIIAKNPQDIDAHGELGNVYYAAGMIAEAAQSYFDAASAAIEQNQPELAEALLPVVIEGNPMLATQLNDKLFEAQMRANMARPMPMQQPQGPQQNNS